MVLDRTWNKNNQTLTISYIDKEGNRQFYQKQMQYWKTYEYDKDGEYNTWNGKKCNKVYKNTFSGYVPNEFDILEYMFEMKDNPKTAQLYNDLHALNYPKIYAFDIETKFIKGEFPDAEEAKHEVTTISLVNDKFDCIVYGTKPLSPNGGYEKYQKLVRDYLHENEYINKLLGDYEPKVLYTKFNTEQELIKHFYTVLLPKIACIAGWNSYRFDFTYLMNRAKRLFGEKEFFYLLKKASPTGEIGKVSWKEADQTTSTIKAPNHTIYLDYMELVKRYDTSIKVKESFSLDWISTAAIGAHKVKYDGDLDDLYNTDYDWYVFYNAIDSILVQAIHHRMKCLKCPCANSAVTLVSLLNSYGQVALTTANIFWEFYMDGRHVVYNENEIDRTRNEYEGAFCGCVPGYASWCICDDFASLYPSMVRTCNLSMENLYEPEPDIYTVPKMDANGNTYEETLKVPKKWTKEQLEEFKKDKNYFVSVMGNVYLNDKDYAFKRMQTRLAKTRNYYKYNAQAIERELVVEIDRLIEEKEKNLSN